MYLLGLAAAVATAACRWLPGARWVYREPQLGLAGWYVVLAVVVTSVAGAASSLVVHWPTAWHTVCTWWAWCAGILSGQHGSLAQVSGWMAAAALAAVGMRAGLSIARTVHTTRRQLREQLALVRLVGRWDPRLQAMVIADPRPAAYLIPGRGGAVVVTTGAISALPPAQLAAVLAHERAHATGRHHLLVQGARLLAAALPAIHVFTRARTQIERLVEICADQAAAGTHHGLDLAHALVTCAEATAAPAPSTHPMPAGAVAATGGDAAERIQRLLAPPVRLSRTGHAAVTAALVALAAAPLLLIGLLATFPVLAACLPTM
jgi:Zn-dependent protease with chaperone function